VQKLVTGRPATDCEPSVGGVPGIRRPGPLGNEVRFAPAKERQWSDNGRLRLDVMPEARESPGGGRRGSNMKKFVFTLMTLAALSTSAGAVCSKNALKGTWVTSFAGTGVVVVNSTGTLPIFIPGGSFPTLTINNFGSNCKGSATVKVFTGSGFLPLPSTIESEVVSSSSDTKPNLVTVKISQFPITYIASLVRVQ
jgi:hypothetical protein